MSFLGLLPWAPMSRDVAKAAETNCKLANKGGPGQKKGLTRRDSTRRIIDPLIQTPFLSRFLVNLAKISVDKHVNNH